MRISFTDNASDKLVTDKIINPLKLLRQLDSNRVKAVVKAVCFLCGTGGGKPVSEQAQHHLLVTSYVCRF